MMPIQLQLSSPPADDGRNPSRFCRMFEYVVLFHICDSCVPKGRVSWKHTGLRKSPRVRPNMKVCSTCASAPDGFGNKQFQRLTQLVAAMNMLRRFTYYSNYVDLTRLELSMILALSVDPPRMFAFIGSGPLPLSSLCIADSLSRENGEKVLVHNIDNHYRAIEQSSEMCRALGAYAQCLRFQCAEATAADGLEAYDVVYLASLVGPTQTQKRDIISNLVQRMRPGALLVLRSAHSLRSLLYPVKLPTTALWPPAMHSLC